MAQYLSKLTARQWFWYLTIGAGLFAFFGRGSGAAAAPGADQLTFLGRAERVPWEVVDTLLTPGKAVFSGAQWLASSTVQHLAEGRADQDTVASLRDAIQTRENQIDYLNGQILELNDQLREVRNFKPAGLLPSDLLPADITGMQAGPGAATVSLDKGSSDGVTAGMVIIAKSSALGRVTAAGPKTSTVELLTDPGYAGVRAQILRKSDEGDQIIVPTCLVKGFGNGEMMCDTIDAQNTPIAPAAGDRVQIVDGAWPRKLQYMVIGEVSAVKRNEKQVLRYDLRISPRISAGSVRSVLVVLHGD